MSAPIPLTLYGVVQERFQLFVNPFATLDLNLDADDQLD